MTNEQIREALKQVETHCDLTQDFLSMRGTLYTLGFHGEEAEEVLRACHAGGFTYCLDPAFEATHFDPSNPRAVDGMVTDRPSEMACYWTPEQLKSRVHCVYIR